MIPPPLLETHFSRCVIGEMSVLAAGAPWGPRPVRRRRDLIGGGGDDRPQIPSRELRERHCVVTNADSASRLLRRRGQVADSLRSFPALPASSVDELRRSRTQLCSCGDTRLGSRGFMGWCTENAFGEIVALCGESTVD